jgi:hypothetical protein
VKQSKIQSATATIRTDFRNERAVCGGNYFSVTRDETAINTINNNVLTITCRHKCYFLRETLRFDPLITDANLNLALVSVSRFNQELF